MKALWHGTRAPWVRFDHEAAFGYAGTAARNQALAPPALAIAEQATVQAVADDPNTWEAVPGRPGRNNRDQLAVDGDGTLVIVEPKHAGSGSGLFYGPLQPRGRGLAPASGASSALAGLKTDLTAVSRVERRTGCSQRA